LQYQCANGQFPSSRASRGAGSPALPENRQPREGIPERRESKGAAMKFAALALDYDGTIATDGAFDPAVRAAIGELRRRGVVVILVTGRRLDDLRRVAGDVSCFDVIVAENGAVLDFPASGRHVVVGHGPQPVFRDALAR